MQLDHLIEKLNLYISRGDLYTSDVSKASTFWHIDHSFRSIIDIIDELHASNPQTYRRTFHLLRYIILWFGWIPRGRAQAPEKMLHKDDIATDSLRNLYVKTAEAIKHIQDLAPRAHFMHFGFGQLKREEAIRFAAIHTWHHLKIIRDIIANTK